MARWKVGRVNAIPKGESSGSAALGMHHISDSFPLRGLFINEDREESDFFKACSHVEPPSLTLLDQLCRAA
jgi:hypothetical protein